MRRKLIRSFNARTNLVLVIVALVLIACTSPAAQPAAPQQEVAGPLKVGVTRWVGYAPLYIADAKGFFAQEGVEVEVFYYDTVQEMSAEFAIRNLDANASLSADTIAQAAAGIPVQIVWVFDNSLGGDVVVGDPDISRAEDLRGRRVGLVYGTFSHAFVVAGLSKYGLTPNDVTIVNVSEEEVPAAIAAGEIDAGHTYEPFLSEALDDGAQVLYSSADTPGVIVDLFAVHTHIIESRPQDVEAMLRAFVAAQEFWAANPVEGNAIVGEVLGIPAAEIPLLFEGLKFFTLDDNLIAFNPAATTNDSLAQTSQLVADLLLDAGVIDRIPDFEQVLNPAFVQAVAGN